MDEARLRADEFGEMGQEGDDVMLGHPLDLIDALDVELGLAGLFPDRLRGLFRDDADLGQRVAGMGLDLEPDAEARLGRPDGDHLGAGIARDHRLSCCGSGRVYRNARGNRGVEPVRPRRRQASEVACHAARNVDAIVLGAGMVGVSAALALQARGRKVALVDRHGEAADETSYGNAGIVQSEAVFPTVSRATRPRSPRRAEPRPARPYPLRGAALDRAGAVAIFPGLRPPGRTRPRGRWRAAGRRRRRRARKFAEAAGAERAAAADRLDQGLAHRARRGRAAHEEIEELKQYGVGRTSRPRRADGARAQCRRGRARRRAFPRSADDAGPAGAGARLCGSVRQARRAVGDGRRAEARAVGPGAGR